MSSAIARAGRSFAAIGGFVFAFIQAWSGQSGWGFVPHSALAAEFAAAAVLPAEADALGAALPVAAALVAPDAAAEGAAVAAVPAESVAAADAAAEAVVAALADALGVAVDVDAVEVDAPEDVPSVFVHPPEPKAVRPVRARNAGNAKRAT